MIFLFPRDKYILQQSLERCIAEKVVDCDSRLKLALEKQAESARETLFDVIDTMFCDPSKYQNVMLPKLSSLSAQKAIILRTFGAVREENIYKYDKYLVKYRHSHFSVVINVYRFYIEA